MWLFKHTNDHEFHTFRVSKSLQPLQHYIRHLFESSNIQFNNLGGSPLIYQVLVDGEEVGFVGEVEILSV